MVKTVHFSILKIKKYINFMHLWSKLTSEVYQKLGSLNETTKNNRLKFPTLPHFTQKTVVFNENQ